jgi:hypothetical protein
MVKTYTHKMFIPEKFLFEFELDKLEFSELYGYILITDDK